MLKTEFYEAAVRKVFMESMREASPARKITFANTGKTFS